MPILLKNISFKFVSYSVYAFVNSCVILNYAKIGQGGSLALLRLFLKINSV